MKQWGLVFIGGSCVLALGAAYAIGRLQGSGEGFWRFEVGLESGRAPREVVRGVELAAPVRQQARVSLEMPDAVHGPEAEPQLASLGVQRKSSEEPLRRSLVTGPLLEGWYENGQMHFRGHQLQTQDGVWLREGDWEAWHENGSLHELGAYRNDVEYGAWRWFYENGARMSEGQFVAGQKVGGWLFWHANGRQMMEGAYVAGERSGRWLLHHDNGVRAGSGSFEEGQATGEWTFWLEDGTVDVARTGLYEQGELVRDR